MKLLITLLLLLLLSACAGVSDCPDEYNCWRYDYSWMEVNHG